MLGIYYKEARSTCAICETSKLSTFIHKLDPYIICIKQFYLFHQTVLAFLWNNACIQIFSELSFYPKRFQKKEKPVLCINIAKKENFHAKKNQNVGS